MDVARSEVEFQLALDAFRSADKTAGLRVALLRLQRLVAGEKTLRTASNRDTLIRASQQKLGVAGATEYTRDIAAMLGRTLRAMSTISTVREGMGLKGLDANAVNE
jgi:hypothetical protein